MKKNKPSIEIEKIYERSMKKVDASGGIGPVTVAFSLIDAIIEYLDKRYEENK